MKRSICWAAACCLFFACNNAPSTMAPEPAKAATDSAAAVKPMNSPYEIMYSSKFAIDDPKNAETVLTLWKEYDNGDLSAGKGMLADSVTLRMGDGSTIRASRDSVVAMVQTVRNSFKSAVDRVDAVMAVKSVDKNEHWALIWGVETDTHTDGKVDSTALHEAWRFDANGKANLIMQFVRPAGPPAPKKKK